MSINLSSYASGVATGLTIFATDEQFVHLENEINENVNLAIKKTASMPLEERTKLERDLRLKARELLQELHLLKLCGCPVSQLAEISQRMISQLDDISRLGTERDHRFLGSQESIRGILNQSLLVERKVLPPLFSDGDEWNIENETTPGMRPPEAGSTHDFRYSTERSSLLEQLEQVEQLEESPFLEPGQVIDFSSSFARGLVTGAKESGVGIASLVAQLATHPIDTGKEILEGFALLSKLAHDEEWETIGQALSPEIHDLVTRWDTLSFDERGRLAGHAVGKIGTDILIPGTTIKLIGVGTKQVETAARGAYNMRKINKLPSSIKRIISEEISFKGNCKGYLHRTYLDSKPTFVATIDLLVGEEAGYMTDLFDYVVKEAQTQQVEKIIIGAKFLTGRITSGEILDGHRLANVLKNRYGMQQIRKGVGMDFYEISIDKIRQVLRK